MKIPSQIGYWKPLEKLGAGGNAIVYRAQRPDDKIFALKVLKAVDQKSEPFRRFRDEITVLKSLTPHPGVLDLVDFSLPEKGGESPWLAMPVASSVRDALGNEATLNQVVTAIHSYAKTLADLATRKIFHRDLKPENLYSFEGRWVVGDFGLVKYPEKEPVTEDGKMLGPRFYMAPEMMVDAAAADPAPADVFSLSKTLWVLATGQRHPLPGELRVDVEAFRISSYVNHPKARDLDYLIERCTRFETVKRPTMQELEHELFAWLTPPGTARADLPELDQLAKGIKAAAAEGKAEFDHIMSLHDAIRSKQDKIRSTLSYAKKQLLKLSDEVNEFEDSGDLSRVTVQTDARVDSGYSVTATVRAKGEKQIILKCSCCMWIKIGGEARLAFGVFVQQEPVWFEERKFALGSSIEDHAFTELNNKMNEMLPVGFDRMNQILRA